MAEVITRFKLETTQYNSKLRDAAKGLVEVTKQASLAGNEFGKYTQKNVEAARSFGQISTSATNSKDKVKELVSAFNDVAKAYNALTKEQQQSDFGKALAESMNTLKGRISEAKDEMNSTGGILSQLKDKFTVNIDALKLFNVGLNAAKGALSVAKDAFFASEQNIDNWGRTLETGQAIYEGFLTALNTGDISGYLNRIGQITQAARDAYDELDKLSTQKAIDNPRAQAQRVENERFRAMLRTGKYIAPNDGRKASMAEGTVLTADQKARIAKQLENGLKTSNSIIASEIKQTTKAINALYTEQASVLGMSEKEFRKGTASMEEFNKRLEGYKMYSQFERQHTIYDDRSIVGHRDKAVNPYAEYAAWGVFKDDGQLFQRIQELITQRASIQSQNYANTAQAYRAINTGTRITGGGKGGSGKTEEEIIAEINAKILSQWETAMLKGAIGVDKYKANESAGMSDAWKAYTDSEHKSGGGSFNSILSAFKALNKKEGITPTGEIAKKQERTFEEQLQGTQTMIASLQGILGGIENLGIEIPKEITAVIGVLQTITGIIGAIQSMVTVGTFLGLFQNGGVIHAASGYSVPGNSFSGDNIPIMANAGEVVLTQAMAGNLASQLRGSGLQNMRLTATVTGEDIILSVNNTLKRKNRGELATWR